MNVNSELKAASLEKITTAQEATVKKEAGMTYYNKETNEILVANTLNQLERFQRGLNGAVGDVKASVLTEAQFIAESGFGWTLADGKNVIGSDYDTITGFPAVPDLRGTFLRGKNHSRADGFADPAGDKALALPYAYATGAPNNPAAIPTDSKEFSGVMGTSNNGNILDSSSGGAASPTGGTKFNHSHIVDKATGWDADTAPVHTVVNYFIRINR